MVIASQPLRCHASAIEKAKLRMLANPKTTPRFPDKREVDMEEDPFLVEYDLVVCGTSLVASIVAASAAKSGKKVVHLDANSFYGSRDAALSLEQLFALMHKSSNGDADIDVDDQEGGVEIPVPSILSTLDVQETIKAPSIKDQRLSTRIRVYSSRCEAFGDTVAIDSFLQDGRCGPAPLPADLIKNGAVRKVVTDLFPRLTLSRGPITSLLVESNTASYLEFKALEASFMVKEEKTEVVSPTAHGDITSSVSWSLQRVPSSKADVFNAPDTALSLLEKRRLMKFLLFAQDKERQATEDAAKDAAATEKESDVAAIGVSSAASVQRLNEKELGSGRSLLRPQNKSSGEFDLDAFRGDTFKSFLTNGASLSPSLANLITYAVAQEEGGNRGVLGAEEGMRNVCGHIGALGRFGNSAFIASLYGSGELAQAFCRLCAVHGGLYMLRTGVHSFSLSKEDPIRCEFVKLSDGHTVKIKKSGSILTESSFLPCAWRDQQTSSTGPIISAICLTRRPLQLLKGSENGDNNSMELVHIVVPPNTKPTLHSRAVYILQQGPGSCVVPSNHPMMRMVHISTRAQTSSIIDQDAAANAVIRTMKHLFESDSSGLAWHVVYCINSISPSTSIPSKADLEKSAVTTIPSNICAVKEEGVSMYHFEQHVEQASLVLRRLFPDNKIAVLFPPENKPNSETVSMSNDDSAKELSTGEDQEDVELKGSGAVIFATENMVTATNSTMKKKDDGNDDDDVDIEESLRLLQGAL